MKIGEYVEKMSVLWVEGQVVQLTRRPGARTAYLTLRDPDVDMSLSCSVHVNALDAMPGPLAEGARVVLQAKPAFWSQRGSLVLDARQIRPVGVGELLARLEYLKRHLAQEGLFDRDRKRPLPFLPRRIGLVCGRASAAEKDVVENTLRRWPSARFEVRQVAVQGAAAVTEVTAALAELDSHPEVDVVVIARVGVGWRTSSRSPTRRCCGPSRPRRHRWSARSATTSTPRCSTSSPTTARPPPPTPRPRSCRTPRPSGVGWPRPRERGHRALAGRLHQERRRLTELSSRPVLADKGAFLRGQHEVVEALRARARRRVEGSVQRERDRVEHLRAQSRTLSPQSTLDRGYAVVQHADGGVVTDPALLSAQELLRVRVARGDFGARVVGADA